MSEFRLSAADEYPHAPGEEPNFNESVYVNGFDPGQRIGGWMRIGNRVNEGHAEAQVCLYLPDGRIACQFQRPDITSNRQFAAGGLEYAVVAAQHSVRMDYAGDVMLIEDPNLLRNPRELFRSAPRAQAAVTFELDGVSPVHGGEPVDADQPTLYGRDFSLGHFFQHTRTRASLEIDGQRWSFDGLGWRDHSWGPRYWTNIWYYRLLIGNFGPDRGMMLLKITGRDGVTRRHGVLQYDGEYEDITDLDIVTDWNADKDPQSIRIGVKTARRAAAIHGEVLTLAPLRNRREVNGEMLESRIAEGLTRWRWDEREGLGIAEYIEFLEHGEPVGYPL